MRQLLLIVALLPSMLFAQYNLVGDAISLGGDCFRLTTTITSQEGAVWKDSLINLENSFDFTFQLNLGASDGGADGMTFVLQQNNTGIGIDGGSLGYESISPSVAVEFDTYQNGTFADPTYDHLAVISNGSVSHFGATPLTTYYQILPGVSNLEDGAYHDYLIKWVAEEQTLYVYVDCNFRVSYTGDIVEDIFGGDPEVYFGFTAATGGAVNNQTVCFENFTNPMPPDTIADAAICEGDSVQLFAPAGYDTYTWSPATGISDPGSANPFFFPTDTTVYIVNFATECGDLFSDTVTIYVNQDNSFFTYGTTTYCAEGTVLPTVLDLPGGLFTAEPDGLTINVSTGELTLDGAIPGDYVIEYISPFDGCPEAHTETIIIEPFPDAAISYPASVYCASGVAIPDDIATPGGIFSIEPDDAFINPATGGIDLATTTVGTTYTIYYDVSLFCSATDSFTITIQDFEDPFFAYPDDSYCPTGTVLPSTIATIGGTFSVTPAGLDVYAATGEIDLSTGTIVTVYTINYLTSLGDCGEEATFDIEILPLDDPGFSYPGDLFCATGVLDPDFIATPGGTFSVSPASLSIDFISGTINLETGTVGVTYFITYTTPDGPCQDATTVSITIDANDDSSFVYPADTYCPFGSALPLSIATPGGSFSVSPAGLSVDPITGALDLAAAAPAVYIITYTTPAGLCSSSSSQVVNIDSIVDAFFEYDAPAYCREGLTTPFVLNPGGIFSADAGCSIDPEDGTINLETSTAGVYNVYYDSPGCSEQDTFSITIYPDPVLTFFPASPLCQEAAPLLLEATPGGGIFTGPGVTAGYFYPAAAGVGLHTLTYNYTDANGCSSELSANIQVIANAVNAGADISIIEGTGTPLEASGGSVFEWSPADGLSCTGCQSPYAQPESTTTYYVTSFSNQGCVAYDTITVTVLPFDDITVFVPNAFTPNGDGVNDYLFIYGSDIAMISSLRVYDRWGSLIWQGANLPAGMETNGWDGGSNGEQAMAGTYAVVAEVLLTFGVSKVVYGNVTLLR